MKDAEISAEMNWARRPGAGLAGRGQTKDYKKMGR